MVSYNLLAFGGSSQCHMTTRMPARSWDSSMGHAQHGSWAEVGDGDPPNEVELDELYD